MPVSTLLGLTLAIGGALVLPVATTPRQPLAAVAAEKLRVTVRPVQQTARVYERAEFDIVLSGGAVPYANPFDPEEVAVDAVLSGPGGRRLTLPAFWYAPYARQTLPGGRVDIAPVAGQKPGWRLRIAPTAPGSWRLVVQVRDRSGTAASAPLTFRTAPPSPGAHGFVRRATGAGRARYFEHSDGAPYFLVGENVCWSGRERGLADYDTWFAALGKSGANFARLWMQPRAIENQETGAGRYDLKNAAYFDAVLETAERNGLSCMLALGTYGELVTGGYFNEGKWPVHPYNAANGGPVPADKPDAFFTDPTARQLYRNRLRYLTARYAAYPGLGFWELWNERGGPPDWFAETAAYLKQTDPYRRPVTNSYSSTGPAEIWNIPQIDLTQTHRYGDEGSIRDIAPGLPGDTRAHDVYKKPHLMGEFGISWRGPDTKFDERGLGTNLHNGLWAGALSGAAGGAMIWWWDSYVHPRNLYPTFTGLANFAKNIDWPRRAFEPLYLSAPTRQGATETFQDLTLTPEPSWGAKSAGPVTIGADGAPQGPGALLGFLYSPAKADLRSIQELKVTLPRPSVLRMRIGTVSDRSELRVTVDGKPAETFVFDPTPGGPGGYKETKHFPEYGGLYQARFDSIREIPLPTGTHRVTLENTSGDWIGITAYEIPGALSSRYTPLRTTALQDQTSGETLVWLHDPESNWANDQSGKTPHPWKNITLRLPLPHPGHYQAEWWDTRKGVIVSRTTANASSTLLLKVPAFTRDIALRVVKK